MRFTLFSFTYAELQGSAAHWGRICFRRRTEENSLRKVAMPVRPNPHAQAALQYLIWALEEIEKAGNEEAALYVRKALGVLRQFAHRSTRKE